MLTIRSRAAIVLRKVAGVFQACRSNMTFASGTLARPFRPMETVLRIAALLLQPFAVLAAAALLLVVILHHGAHAVTLIPALPVMGSTTGTQSSGTFTGLNDALKQTYTGPFANNIEGEMEVTEVFQAAGDFETTDGPDGKQVNIGHYIAGGGGVSAMAEDSYIPDSTPPVWKQGNITIKQIAAVVSLSGRVLRRVKEGPAAFASWAEMALPEKAKRVAFHKDRMLIGTGTGIVARINGAPDGTGDAVDTAYGIAGLEGALNLFLMGDSFRYSANADGSSPRTGVAVVSSIDYNGQTFNTTISGSAGAPTSAADNDYLFLGSANVNGAGIEPQGLESMIDDGTNVSTFQGITRSTYPSVLNAQIVDSTAYAQSPSVLSENIIDYADSLCWERAGGKPSVLLVNRNGQRSFWNSLKGDRVINDPQGQFTGGKVGLRMLLGDRVLQVKAARKVPSSRAYLLDTSTLKRFQIGAGRWDDITGSVWNRVTDSTGAKDAVYAVYIEEEEYACVYPARSAKITGLAAA